MNSILKIADCVSAAGIHLAAMVLAVSMWLPVVGCAGSGKFGNDPSGESGVKMRFHAGLVPAVGFTIAGVFVGVGYVAQIDSTEPPAEISNK